MAWIRPGSKRIFEGGVRHVRDLSTSSGEQADGFGVVSELDPNLSKDGVRRRFHPEQAFFTEQVIGRDLASDVGDLQLVVGLGADSSGASCRPSFAFGPGWLT